MTRSIEDLLREQYFQLVPEMTRIADHLKTQIQFRLLQVASDLRPHENLVVKSRVKECNSAIDALRRRNPGGVFDRDHPELYSLLTLPDLVGIRVLAFPSTRANEANHVLRSEFIDWKSDPVLDKETGQTLAFKYYGQFRGRNGAVQCEYQIVSMLIGLFWEVEHAAIYKPAPSLKGMTDSPVLRELTSEVYRALKTFEDEFERQLHKSESVFPLPEDQTT